MILLSIQAKLAEGKSHARARGEALAEYLGMDAESLNSPNLTLGIEYIRAIRELKPNMQPAVIPRIGGYHDNSIGAFASASANLVSSDSMGAPPSQWFYPDIGTPIHGIGRCLGIRCQGSSTIS